MARSNVVQQETIFENMLMRSTARDGKLWHITGINGDKVEHIGSKLAALYSLKQALDEFVEWHKSRTCPQVITIQQENGGESLVLMLRPSDLSCTLVIWPNNPIKACTSIHLMYLDSSWKYYDDFRWVSAFSKGMK